MVKINWTNSSVEDLQTAREFAALTSVAYAARLVERLIARTEILATFPKSGRQVPEFGNPIIRELLEGNFRIVYRVVNNGQIDITRIHHASQPFTNPG